MSALHAVQPMLRTAITLEAIRGRATITVPEAAELLGIGRNACYEAVRRGDITALHFGARIVVPVGPLLKQLGIDV